VPLVVPLTLLKHHLNRHPVPDWVHQQVYLHPYPKELMLRNHVWVAAQWSGKAIERTTPCLFGSFSLVVLMAKVLHPASIPARQTCWYVKEKATVIDALAAVWSNLWRYLNCSRSSQNPNVLLVPRRALFSLLQVACHAT
jgi:hypothetical protein